jgi:hypothetical protein
MRHLGAREAKRRKPSQYRQLEKTDGFHVRPRIRKIAHL